MAPKRLAVARLWHEGNSFTPFSTTLADFERREWFVGAEPIARYRGTGTELGAVADFMDAAAGRWQVTVLRCASAPPGGPLEDALFDRIVEEIAAGLAAGSWDAVYLSLHGALLSMREPEADLHLLRRVRAAIGQTPLGVSFDLHANLSPAILPLIDFASGYKTHPHVDMRETAARVLSQLEVVAQGGARPFGALRKVPALLHSFNMRTESGPMAETMALARGLIQGPVLDAGAFGGFVWADTPSAGATALAYATELSAAEAAAAQIADALWQKRGAFRVSLPNPEEGIARALAVPGPVAVLEPSDNPLSGGIADTTGLLAALLRRGLKEEAVFAFFFDPDLVAEAHRKGVGARIACALGGRIAPHFGPPQAVQAEVERLTAGRFVNEGPFETGMTVDLGPTALLRVGRLRIIVASSCQAGIDPAYFRLHGIDTEAVRLIAAKAKNHFRAAYGARLAAIVEVDTPGPAALDLAALPFRYLPPGIER